MDRAYPNMVDLLIICAESGMSIEHAVRKVSQEIGTESVELAEEMSLLAAEMSYLENRRIAFENLGVRTGLDAIKQLTTVLIQSEKYGTPLGAALARAGAGKPRRAHDGGGEEGGGAAAGADRADDPLLPARPVLRDSDARRSSRSITGTDGVLIRRAPVARRRRRKRIVSAHVRRTRPPSPRGISERARARGGARPISIRSTPSSAAPSRRSTARCWCSPAPASARPGC